MAEELPRLTTMVDKVAHVHGQRLPSLYEIRDVFAKLRDELLPHIMKEHEIVYPLIRASEAGVADDADDRGNSMPDIIEELEEEHRAFDGHLANLRSLAKDYIPPHDACRTHRAVLAGLEQLERETYDHIHKEDNILFQRARAHARE